ncbi:MAG: hypothetical protein SGJ21_06415 [Alphaproteobacteria bacterium]|nr:hypothetical protein [Alphaproteobacteria bacterium]
MKVRAIIICLLVALASEASALAQTRLFKREDYETFFAPGRFKSHAAYYASHGLLEIVKNRSTIFAGRYFLEQTMQALDVSANYDTLSANPYYKIESRGAEVMVWDDRLKAYLYEYSAADFDGNASIVWESTNDQIEITPDDSSSGDLHEYYRAADVRASQDVDALHSQYRRDVVGGWSMQCGYIRDDEWDVECKVLHQPTQRLELYYYRKLDLIS